jgi:hypothetical protein
MKGTKPFSRNMSPPLGRWKDSRARRPRHRTTSLSRSPQACVQTSPLLHHGQISYLTIVINRLDNGLAFEMSWLDASYFPFAITSDSVRKHLINAPFFSLFPGSGF